MLLPETGWIRESKKNYPYQWRIECKDRRPEGCHYRWDGRCCSSSWNKDSDRWSWICRHQRRIRTWEAFPCTCHVQGQNFWRSDCQSWTACSWRRLWTYLRSLHWHKREGKDGKTCSSYENLPYPHQYSIFSGRYRRPLQLQTCSVPDFGLRFLGWQLRIWERRCETSYQHQDRCWKERKYALD